MKPYSGNTYHCHSSVLALQMRGRSREMEQSLERAKI
ncbi:unnamed protein product, partial [Allacma fusca]